MHRISQKKAARLEQKEPLRRHKTKPLYKRMEEKFQQDVEMPELERRKRELANRRNMYARVPYEEILEH